jgi:hypothetical protein
MIARATAALLLIAAVASAELPPEVYEELQRKAPEVLFIEVTSVDVDRQIKKPSGCSWLEFEVVRNVELEARVIRVVRSAAGVRPGTVIRVEYPSNNRCEGYNGPRSIELLRKGERVNAFLVRGDRGVFVPAARGATFSAERIQ